MLCEELMERLRPITEEEQQILLGSDIDRKRYTTGREFTMDRVYLTQFSAATIERRSGKRSY